MNAVYVGYMPAQVRRLPVKPWWTDGKPHRAAKKGQIRRAAVVGSGGGKGRFPLEGFPCFSIKIEPRATTE